MDLLRIRPLDVLHLRGNRLFADTGHGEVVMPPWPSLFAGALRTRMLDGRGVSFAAFRDGCVDDPVVARVVGTSPTAPGEFRVGGVAMLCWREDPRRRFTATLCVPCPADLVCVAGGADGERLEVHALRPATVTDLGVRGSFPLPGAPVLRTATPVKPVPNVWITAEGLAAHFRGASVLSEHLIPSEGLWRTDSRLGIGLDVARRTTRKSLLYTADALALAPGVEFLVPCAGGGELLPDSGLLRLGGDGRGATVERWEPGNAQWTPWAHRPDGPGFRMVLITPGIFPQGWIPPGVVREGDDWVLALPGLRARLVAALVGRYGTVSGWDLARNAPKTALRVVPAGSVYWFEVRDGTLGPLAALADGGLWDPDESLAPEMRARRAEGFNNVCFGDWDGHL